MKELVVKAFTEDLKSAIPITKPGRDSWDKKI